VLFWEEGEKEGMEREENLGEDRKTKREEVFKRERDRYMKGWKWR